MADHMQADPPHMKQICPAAVPYRAGMLPLYQPVAIDPQLRMAGGDVATKLYELTSANLYHVDAPK